LQICRYFTKKRYCNFSTRKLAAKMTLAFQWHA
jgi:hypothetical protein